MPPLNFIQWSGVAAILGGVVYAATLSLLGPLVRLLYSPSSPDSHSPDSKLHRNHTRPFADTRRDGRYSGPTYLTKRTLRVAWSARLSHVICWSGAYPLGWSIRPLGAGRGTFLLFGRLCPYFRRNSDDSRTSDFRRRDYSCEGIAGVGRSVDHSRQPTRGVFVR